MQPPLSAFPAAVVTALELVEVTPEKYVPCPSPKLLLSGHINMLQAFQTRVRHQAEKVRLREVTKDQLEEEGMLNSNNKSVVEKKKGKVTLAWTEPADKTETASDGLGTSLFDQTRQRSSRPGNVESVEDFLKEFERTTSRLLNEKVLYKDGRKISPFEKELTNAVVELRKEEDYVLAPTDKTGNWTPMLTTSYAGKLLGHIEAKCVEVNNSKLESVHDEALILLNRHRGLMNSGEANYIERWISSRQLPMPWLLVKDHKNVEKTVNIQLAY